MSLLDVLQKVAGALDHAGIPYMLTGSFASVYYGSPRSTRDIDLVISATSPQLRSFIAQLPSGEYYADLDAALEAQQHQSLFNIIDLKTGWKIDLIIRKNRAFSKEEFSRRQRIILEGVSFFVATAEDVILAKLEWSKLAESQRHIEDAEGILKIQDASLDREYLNKWIHGLELEKQWATAKRIAEN
jgi:hypothetical protein